MTNTKPATKPAYYKSLEEIALLLTLRPGRTDKGRAVSKVVLTRVEIAMAERELFGTNQTKDHAP